MIKSMTAFGRAKSIGDDKDVTVEIKSVNSRFFDCNVKIPRAYAFLEERIKNYVQKNAVARAKVDVYVTIDSHTTEGASVEIDRGYLESYLKALYTLRDEFSLRDDVSVMSVAKSPDVLVFSKADEDLEKEWSRIASVLDEAIKGYDEMRTAEGKKAEEDVKAKIEQIRAYAEEVEQISKSDTVGYRDKLESRIRAILGETETVVDENRLLTECAIWADKIAIDEELVRLRSHFDALEAMAELDTPVGRKFDFQLQESGREINTIGSKCQNAEIAKLVVEMKNESEKIREQIQNIE